MEAAGPYPENWWLLSQVKGHPRLGDRSLLERWLVGFTEQRNIE